MSTTISNNHAWPATRSPAGLLDLARSIAAATHPELPVELTPGDRRGLATVLPHIGCTDEAAAKLADIIGELHEADLASRRTDHNDPDAPDDETVTEFLASADTLAAQAVEADLAAQRPALRLVRGGNVPMAGVR